MMYKQIVTTIFITLFFICPLYSQSFLKDAPMTKFDVRHEKNNCRPYYIGLSTGINNMSGLLGVDVDYALSAISTVGAHIGMGTWGIKTGLDAKYYRRNCHLGWAYGIGMSLATGNRNKTLNLETISGPKDVTLNLHPQAGLQFNVLRYFPIGKQGHRFWIQVGWNQRFTRKVYTILDGQTLTRLADRTINFLCPGGLVIAGGYAMGFGGKKRKS